ncbi:MAG TPA: hypothetical protein DHV08_06195 [Rhodocyclaceae bacterium]|nr:MAG: hypothetical protein AUK49_07050 [Betaproteobacteria bacterium CG2_30_68_42]PIV72274.1 MAG: hypothetical protein COW56_10070 [Rhodocyclales bacterium CG17_big_fil_post_rev_8_21_14_2_50_68_7]PIX75268.1 MAG: hypothetical protein COZ38_06475 [Rhodocyclales bacterium CG_4_10_14_3_um_filter_68_10]PJA56918.1 MAG: hypothetical protein CO164_10565 [Rhodocyclales bacterium CG_4_9_14_3_um_filter_68_10]HCX33175.1 hypothetical protein [Rhodocyclaceae bacterium]
MKKSVLIVSAMLAAFGLAACGERPQVNVYQQGKYQGKADTAPYDNPAFGKDKAKWEAAVRARGQGQDEYTRGG